MGLSMFYDKQLPDEARLKLLDCAHARGVTFWDSADVYADNEDLLAKYNILPFSPSFKQLMT
jgi:aryl-alcohol dehydrogenase-like predicted oxidoreductase